MLVLSRKVGQRILIGDQIVVTIVRVGQGGVRVGIEAPRDLAVVREELTVTSHPLADGATAKKETQRSPQPAQQIIAESSGVNSSGVTPSAEQSLAKPPATGAGNGGVSSPKHESDDSAGTPRVLPR